MKVRYLKPIGGTPVQRFLQKAVRAEQDHHPTFYVTNANWDQEGVFFANKKGEIIAAMAFERSTWDRKIGIGYAYVDALHRRKGLHTKMFEAVCKIAKRDGYFRVSRVVNGDNKPMIAAIKKQGCKETTRLFCFSIEHTFPKPIEDKFEL